MAGASELSGRDLREVQNATNWAAGVERDMGKLKSTVEDMGSWSLYWDAQGIFNSSDKETVRKGVEVYRDFYTHVKDAFGSVRNGSEDADELIQELYDILERLEKEAVSDVNRTKSKTLCKLHKDFIDKHEMLENKIKRVEVVAVRQQLRRMREDWHRSLDELRRATESLEESRQINQDLAARFTALMTINEQSLRQQEELRQENRLIRTLLEQLVENRGAN